MNKYAVILVFLLFLTGKVFSVEEIKLQSFVDKAQPKPEDEIKFTIKLTHPSNTSLEIPDVGPQIQGLSIKEFGDSRPEIVKDIVLRERWYILTAPISGTYQLPAVVVKYNNQDYKTAPIFVEFKNNEVTSNNVLNNAQDIRDIKNIYTVPFNWWLPIGCATILLVLILGAWYYQKYHKNKKPIKIIPPHELALRSLLELKNMSFDNHQFAKLFSFKISELIRNYLESIIQINVTDKTTGEIKKCIGITKIINDNQKKVFIQILEDTDLIKFTDFLPQATKKDEIYQLTLNLIEETKPQEIKSDEEDVV